MAELLNDKKQNPFAGWPMIVFWAAVLVFTAHACTHMVAAGDTWVAMACGRHYVNHSVDTVEPFSANSHDAGPTETELEKYPQWFRPVVKKMHPTGWVNQNWGTHAIFYWLAKTFGSDGEYNYNMLVVWKFAVNIIAAVCIFYIARVLDVTPPLAAAAAAFALFVGRTFIDVRPAVFSNMFIPMLILIYCLTTYKNIKYIWLIVPFTLFWCNVHGGYIYVFITLVPFAGFNLLTCPSKTWFTTTGIKGFYHTCAAGITALVATILFNPYHLTNITHTFEVSVSKHAESWRKVNEWHPAFERENPVGDEEAFIVMFIIAWAAFALWVVARQFKPSVDRRRRATRDIFSEPGTYQWPKIDLALMTIAALTIYMAVKSRRFIPVAASASCAVIVMFIDQAIRMIAARLKFNKTGKLILPDFPKQLKYFIIIATAATTLGFGAFWSLKFKRVYLDPWPRDPIRNSIFMRMTASNIKPFDVTQFMRENQLSGNMFNYWTEGGALAFGQEPDPETGRTPLQLFMDGRAQAAYDHSNFILWQQIYAGGPESYPPRIANRYATEKEIKKIAAWIDKEMKKRDIWLFVMPESEFQRMSKYHSTKQFRQLNYYLLALPGYQRWPGHKDWRLAYTDKDQRLYIDVSTEKGKKLISDVFTGKAKFPNEYAKNITLANTLLRTRNSTSAAQGLKYAKMAFDIDHTPQAISEITLAARMYPPLRKDANKYIHDFLNNFKENMDDIAKEAGYLNELSSASIAARHLASLTKKTDTKRLQEYNRLAKECVEKINQSLKKTKW